MKMFLVSQVDGSEVTPLRVVAGRESARETVLGDMFLYDDEPDTDEMAEAAAAFNEAWPATVVIDREQEFGVQFESTQMSVDYRIDLVEVEI